MCESRLQDLDTVLTYVRTLMYGMYVRMYVLKEVFFYTHMCCALLCVVGVLTSYCIYVHTKTFANYCGVCLEYVHMYCIVSQ